MAKLKSEVFASMPVPFFIVDVFAQGPYSGNQLAVVVAQKGLSVDTMQKIALETNYSETTFVAPHPSPGGGYDVRIFTPAREISFAGHPLLGTAHVIRHHVAPDAAGNVILNLSIGPVSVSFEPSSDEGGIVWFAAPSIVAGDTGPRGDVASVLGLTIDDIDDASPPQIMTAGVSALIVPLRSAAALQRSKLNLDAYGDLMARGFPPLVYLFTRETRSPENNVSARFFFDAHGVREDPATGNGAAFLGAYVVKHALFDDDAVSLRIEQGYNLRRPSLVRVRATRVGDTQDISVGGHVVTTIQGELVQNEG